MIDFYVQDGLSDVPSAPPIHAYDQEISQVSQNVDANVCDGSTVKKEEYNDDGLEPNLPEKSER